MDERQTIRKMNSEYCKARTKLDRWPYTSTSPCGRKAWKDGFCKIHHPDEKRRRQDIRDKKKDDLYNARQERDQSELIPFNLNDYILVKLTDKGYQHLADNHNKRFRKIDRDGPFYKNQADSNGYTRIQAWDLIEQFGRMADWGIHNYFDFNILIEIKE